MSDRSQFLVKTRDEIAALFVEKWGTDKVAWPIEPNVQDTGGPKTWLNFFQSAPENGDFVVGRLDMGYFDIIVRVRKEGYVQPVTFEEPSVPFPEDGSPRVVGMVRAVFNQNGFVQTKSESTLIGDTLMIHPTSISRGDPIPPDADVIAKVYFHTNPQRNEGDVELQILRMDFPDDTEGAKKVREVAFFSPDGRTLAVMAKVMTFTNA